MRRCLAWIPLCLVLFQVAPALAQETSSTDAEAHAVFEAGRTAYAAGRFQDALGYFQHAYELSHRPELLYNIGQAQDRLRHDADAIASFEQFMEARPDSPQRDEVVARLAILRSSAPAAAAVTETTPDPTPPVTPVVIAEEPEPAPPPAPSSVDPAPWIVLGIGGAVAIVGAILLAVGYADIASVDAADHVPFASVSGAYADAPVLTGAGWAVLGAGVALAAVGLGWGLASGGRGSADHARLRVGPGGVSITGSF